MDCLEQRIKDFKENHNYEVDRKEGDMAEDTPIWIYAHDPEEVRVITAEDISESRWECVFKALVCIGVVPPCFDEHSRYGRGGSRRTLGLEWALNGVYCTLLWRRRGARGEKESCWICSIRCPFWSWNDIVSIPAHRQRHSPIDLIFKAFNIMVETATVSIELDTSWTTIQGILMTLMRKAPMKRVSCDIFHNTMRGSLASSIAAPQAACREGDNQWQDVLAIMSKSSTTQSGQHYRWSMMLLISFYQQAITPPGTPFFASDSYPLLSIFASLEKKFPFAFAFAFCDNLWSDSGQLRTNCSDVSNILYLFFLSASLLLQKQIAV